jgi:multiple antibiotic resistance protein
MPFTTGPGTISVAIALGANQPQDGRGFLLFALGTSAAAIVIAVMIWVAYRWADFLVAALGPSRAQIVTRLSAFLLLCVGTQITINGVVELVAVMRAG